MPHNPPPQPPPFFFSDAELFPVTNGPCPVVSDLYNDAISSGRIVRRKEKGFGNGGTHPPGLNEVLGRLEREPPHSD